MKTYDIFALITFTILAVVTFIAGFYNWVHFIFCAISVKFVILSLTDPDENGDTLLDWLKGSFVS